ncbi:MAG: NUDIX hydrolase [Candidatus Pacebacteria bacterium]|nr:NUDIX hydrolase [Candidatus Paceibacterota bacterium]
MFTIGVFAIILDKDNKVLICHRCDYDLWNLPGGGLEKNETPEMGVIREVKEETGLDVIVKKITGVYAKKDKNEIVFSFLCEVINGEITLNDEADKINYFEINSIPKNFSPKQLERLWDYFNEPNKIHYKLQEGKSSIELIQEGKL